MQNFPHPTLAGVVVTTPIYIGTGIEKMSRCEHQWPEGLPDNMKKVEDYLAGIQCCLLCGATRAIYQKVKE